MRVSRSKAACFFRRWERIGETSVDSRAIAFAIVAVIGSVLVTVIAAQDNAPSLTGGARNTDPVILAGALVTVIAALAAAIVSVISALAGAEDRRQFKIAREKAEADAAKVIEKSDKIIDATTAIHTTTNSQLSTVKAELAVANENIKGLEKQVTLLIEARTAAVAATAPATVPPSREVTP